MLTLIKTGHPEKGRALSSLAPLTNRFMFLCLWRSDNPRKPQEGVHQSTEQGAPAAGSLECGGERNLYCPIVPLFPRTHHTPGHPVHLQVSSANQPCIPLCGCILSSAATLTDRQHFSVHAGGALIQTHTHEQRGSHQDRSGRTGTQGFLLSDMRGTQMQLKDEPPLKRWDDVKTKNDPTNVKCCGFFHAHAHQPCSFLAPDL